MYFTYCYFNTDLISLQSITQSMYNLQIMKEINALGHSESEEFRAPT